MSDSEPGKVEYVNEWPPREDDDLHGNSGSSPKTEEQDKSASNSKFVRNSNEGRDRKRLKIGKNNYRVARTALAIWHRHNSTKSSSTLSNPDTKNNLPENAKSALNVIKKSSTARTFLEQKLQELEDAKDDTSQGCQMKIKYYSLATLHSDPNYHFTVSTYLEELGRFGDALKSLDKACDLISLNFAKIDDLNNVEYLQRLKNLSDFEKELLWLHAKMKVIVETKKKSVCKVCKFDEFSVDVRESNELSVKEFLSEYVSKGRPVIITGLSEDVIKGKKWDLNFVKELAGNKMASLKRWEKNSTEWARLDPAREMSVAEFINGVQNSLYHNSWPSLFIAPKGVVSDLHVDAFASHFWMFLFQGQKKWTFFRRECIPFLKPNFSSGFDPVFDVNVQSADNEHSDERLLVESLNPAEVILEPGQLLFVPQGSPHHVVNLAASLAVSGNFVDASNMHESSKHLRRNALVDPRAADLLQEMIVLKLVDS